MLRDTSIWMQENKQVREAVREVARARGKAIPDAIVTDPALLAELTKTVVIEAVRLDAPEGVVEDLMKVLRRMGPGLKALSQDSYLTSVLADLEGLRDRYEIEPVLERALAAAPDDTRRTQLGAALELVRAELTVEQLQTIAADDVALTFEPEWCPTCCAHACIICGWDAHLGGTACLACCTLGCLSCTLF